MGRGREEGEEAAAAPAIAGAAEQQQQQKEATIDEDICVCVRVWRYPALDNTREMSVFACVWRHPVFAKRSRNAESKTWEVIASCDCANLLHHIANTT